MQEARNGGTALKSVRQPIAAGRGTAPGMLADRLSKLKHSQYSESYPPVFGYHCYLLTLMNTRRHRQSLTLLDKFWDK